MKTWGFDRVIRTTKKRLKSPCNFVFAVGINAGCLGDPAYWTDLDELTQFSKAKGGAFDINTLPHESAFLSCCGIFLFPHERFPRNSPSVTISAIRKSRYNEFFSWGDDVDRCHKIWAALVGNQPSRTTSEDCGDPRKGQMDLPLKPSEKTPACQ